MSLFPNEDILTREIEFLDFVKKNIGRGKKGQHISKDHI